MHRPSGESCLQRFSSHVLPVPAVSAPELLSWTSQTRFLNAEFSWNVFPTDVECTRIPVQFPGPSEGPQTVSLAPFQFARLSEMRLRSDPISSIPSAQF